MSVGFGFSVGDFLAALKVVGTVIDALHESGSSGTQYRDLINELYTLESALLRVKRVELHESQNAERIALQQAAAQCQRTIDAFLKKTEKYQPHLRKGGSGDRYGDKLKDGWRKIKWALCRKEDVDAFKADLRGHTGSIELLLLTVQMDSTSIQAKRQDEGQRSLATKIQDMSGQWMAKLATITKNVATCVEQGKQLMEATTKIVRTNVAVFQAIMDIQKLLTRVGPQIDRQQPVYFIDAFGKTAPFHLEFVRSAEALIAVLKVNFKASKTGPEKIDRGEFVIEETATQKLVDLDGDWDMCFFPGQKVAMSMTFPAIASLFGSACPKCRAENAGAADQEITCNHCGMVYRRVEELPHAALTSRERIDDPMILDRPKVRRVTPTLQYGPKGKRKLPADFDTIGNFRRVRIIELDDAKRRDIIWTKGSCTLYQLGNDQWEHIADGICFSSFDEGNPIVTFVSAQGERTLYKRLQIPVLDHESNFQIQQGAVFTWTSKGLDYSLHFELEEDQQRIANTIMSFVRPYQDSRLHRTGTNQICRSCDSFNLACDGTWPCSECTSRGEPDACQYGHAQKAIVRLEDEEPDLSSTERHDRNDKQAVEEVMQKSAADSGSQNDPSLTPVNPTKAKESPNGFTANTTAISNYTPTYVKIHIDHLSVDTLRYYDLPYEMDRNDPNYFIILREMDNKETDILFEHTRRLRSREMFSKERDCRSLTKV